MATLNPAFPTLPAPSGGTTGPATPRAAPRQDRPAPPLRGRRAPRLAGILAGLALIAGGAYVAYDRLGPQPPAAAAVATADITVGNITSTISATGSVALPTQSRVGFLSSGVLTELLVRVGDTVTAGQPLARIGDGSLRVALAQAQAGYDSAVAALAKTMAGATPEDVAAARAQVDAARISLAQTQAVPQGADMVAAQSQLAAARLQLQKLTEPTAAAVAAAQAQVDSAASKLQAVLNPRPEDVAAAQSQLAQARLQLEALQNPRAEDVRSAELAVSSAQAGLSALLTPRAEDVAAAQAQLDQARTALAQLTDQPQVTSQAVANAELAVRSAQVAYDKTLADSSLVGKTGGPATSIAAETAIQQALITLQTAQNNLSQLQQQAPSEWEVRNAQLAVETAQASLNKLRSPSAAEVQQAQIAVEQARATLEKLRNPSAYEVQQAQESVVQAQLTLDKLSAPAAADVAAAQQALVSAQVALDTLRDPDPRDVAAAQEAVVQARAGVDKLLTGNAFDVQAAQNAVAQAQIGLAQVQAGSASYDIAAAQAAVNQARAGLDQATANLAGATLTAPISGTVAATGAAVGEQVGASTVAVTLVDTQQIRVDVAVDESGVAAVKPGQQATITFEALTGQRVPGTVAVISPLATTTNGVVTYSVQIALDAQRAQEAGVRAGMTATASIVADSREGVVLAPNRAIRTQGQNKTVQVLTAEGATSTRRVTVGLSNDQSTEIVSGLQAGDRVVITGTTTAAVSASGAAGVTGVALPGAGAPAGPRG